MDEPQSSDENPFSAPQSRTDVPSNLRRIHPALILALTMLSLFIGGCTFFCTCLGMLFIDDTVGNWVLLLSGIAALAAAIGSFRGIVSLIRKSRERAAMEANEPRIGES